MGNEAGGEEAQPQDFSDMDMCAVEAIWETGAGQPSANILDDLPPWLGRPQALRSLASLHGCELSAAPMAGPTSEGHPQGAS